MAITLASLKKGRELKPPLILMHAVPGIGKSTWASEALNPVFIQTEEGLNTLDVVKFPLAKTVDDVFDSIGALAKEDHGFNTVVIDTLDWFEKLAHNRVREEKGADIFTDYGKGYVFALPHITKLLDGLTFLRNTRNMAVVILGHTCIKGFNPPDAPGYDKYQLDVHKEVASTVEEWAEVVLFANYKVFVTKEDAGFGKEKGKAVGKGDRVIYTQERPPFRAKNRYNLPAELPMNYAAFARAMEDGLKSMEKGKASPSLPTPVTTNVAHGVGTGQAPLHAPVETQASATA